MNDDVDDIIDKFRDIDNSKKLDETVNEKKKKSKSQIRKEEYRKRSDEINRGENFIWIIFVLSIFGLAAFLFF